MPYIYCVTFRIAVHQRRHSHDAEGADWSSDDEGTRGLVLVISVASLPDRANGSLNFAAFHYRCARRVSLLR